MARRECSIGGSKSRLDARTDRIGDAGAAIEGDRGRLRGEFRSLRDGVGGEILAGLGAQGLEPAFPEGRDDVAGLIHQGEVRENAALVAAAACGSSPGR